MKIFKNFFFQSVGEGRPFPSPHRAHTDPPLGLVTFKLCLCSHTRQYLQGVHHTISPNYSMQSDQNRRHLRSPAAGVGDLINSVRIVKMNSGSTQRQSAGDFEK